jgi:ATP-binding cassette, subfamily B, bacterial MsbA
MAKKNHDNFWRAIRFLAPYRGFVAIATICAFFVGLSMIGGLGSMLPIIRILINGDTIPTWVNRQIVEARLNVRFADDVSTVHLLRVDPGPGQRAGLKFPDQLGGLGDERQILAHLADPSIDHSVIYHPDPTVVQLPPVKVWFVYAQALAARLPARPVPAIAVIFGVMAGLGVIGNVFRFFQEYLSSRSAIMAVNDIRRHLYDHVLHIPMSRFGEQGTSDVTSRLVQDSSELTDGFNTLLGQSIQEPIKAAMAFCFAIFLSWKLMVFMICFGPLVFVIVKKFGKKMRRASRRALQERRDMLAQLESSLMGIRVVKASGAERFERRRYSQIMHNVITQQLRMAKIDAFSTPTMELMILLVGGCVLLFAAHLVLVSGTLTTDRFIGVMAAMATITESLRRCGKVNNAVQRANAAATRIFEVMDTPVERRTRASLTVREANSDIAPVRDGQIKLQPLQNEIRFEQVCFTYPGQKTPALTDLSLNVPRGSCVAIVGRNGSGKTTLLAMLPRFYDPQGGRITLDGIDISKATLRSLRGQISLVTQDSVIFPGTVAQNIAYGHPLAHRLDKNDGSAAVKELREKIVAAAVRSYAHDFIMEKPLGYDTPLGELGGQLSGGQKQRLCIARTILRHSPIVILDEATSQVDAESEHLIQRAIDGLMHEGQQTTFVIAHRFSTIQSADFLVVLDRGQVVGQGKHEELLATCPTYQQLYERQLLGVGVTPPPTILAT